MVELLKAGALLFAAFAAFGIVLLALRAQDKPRERDDMTGQLKPVKPTPAAQVARQLDRPLDRPSSTGHDRAPLGPRSARGMSRASLSPGRAPARRAR